MIPADANAPPTAEELSALCDGEASADSADQLIRRWSSDSELRLRWHRYALVGDVLRSADLATNCRDDSAFVERWRRRMADEGLLDGTTGQAQAHAHALAATAPPADHHVLISDVLPPREATLSAQPIDLAAARTRRPSRLRRWSAPVGIAAGVLMVSAVVLVSRNPELVDFATTTAGGPDDQVRVLNRNSRHDPRLDPYLVAHKQFQPAVVLAPSSGLLRSAAYDVAPDR